jgi:DNA polymerase-3 subunit gamma/tau
MAGDVPSPAPAESARRGDPAAPAALYRRYRPATFAELKGQDHVTEPLRQALRSGRVHHAYLFSGPRGCGKTSSARILARSLNCEQGPTPDPCGKCASCVALAPSGPGSIDVIEIDAASHGGVDDARDLRERAFYAPVSGRFKIYIVDEAHMVTREGFNALLKLVEEPPPHLKFVFATTEPEKVIPTIRSRTHHYPFRLMPPAVLRGLLEEILASEDVSYEPAVLPVVIRAGAGSARDALSVLDQLLAGSGDSGLTYERAVALLGYTDDSLLDEVAEAFAAGEGAAVFRAVDRVVEAGHDPRRFAADLLDRFRDLIVLAAVPDAAETGLLDVPADRLDRMREQADTFGHARLSRAAQTINTGLVEMRGATSPRLQLELICAQVLLPSAPAPAALAGGEAGGTQDLLARLERLERRLGSGDGGAGHGGEEAGQAARGPAAPPRASAQRPTAAASPAATPPAAAPRTAKPESAAPEVSRDDAPGRTATPPTGTGMPDADSLRERWPAILEAVAQKRRVAWILLSNATVDTLQDGILTLRFTREGEARGFSGSDYDKDLGQVLEAMIGISLRIRAVSAAQGGRAGAGGGAAGGGAAGGGAAAGWSGAAGVAAGGASGGFGVATGAPGGPGLGGSGSISPGGAADPPSGAAGFGAAASGSGGSDSGTGRGGSAASGSGRSGSGAGRSGSGAGRSGSGAGGTGAGRGGNAGAGDVPPGVGGGPGRISADDSAAVEALTGMDLIQRTLGGEVIEEIGDT